MLDRYLLGMQHRPIEVGLVEQRADLSVERTARGIMPTKYGNWDIVSYRDKTDNEEHVAIFKGDITTPEPVLTRMHSACITAETFGAINCDCSEQMDEAMRRIAEEKRGVIVYLHQEGRGNGLAGKLLQLRAMMTNDVDTVTAFEMTGQKGEKREYTCGGDIYKDLGVKAPLRLMTHNPGKIAGLEKAGFRVQPDTFRVNLNSPITARDIQAKTVMLGHLY